MTRITLIATLILTSCNGSPSSQNDPDANSGADGNGSTDAAVDGGLDGSGANVSTCPGATYPGTAICGNAHWTWDRPTPTGVSLHGIWTFAANDVWIAGGEGTVLHYDGASWAVEQTPVCEGLNGIWGTSANDLWAVGDFGRVVHRTQSGWHIVDAGTCDTLQSIWGTSASDIWVSGGGGVMLHGGTQGFTADTTLDHLNAQALWGFASDDVWGVESGTVFHWNGTAWSIALAGNWDLTSIWGSDAAHIFVGGYDWDKHTDAAWMFSAANVMTPTEQTLSGNTSPVVRGTAANDVWLVQANQTWHYDGTKWTYNSAPGVADLYGVAFASPTDGWAVGSDGEMLHWTGTQWSTGTQDHAVVGLWAAAAGDVWAAASNGLLHYDGHAWTSVVGVTGFYYGVWGSSPTDVYAVGLFSQVMHWNGTAWSAVTVPTSTSWYSVAGTGPNDIWVGGYKGAMMHWNGSAWSAVSTGSIYNVNAVWALAPNDVWAATDEGLIHGDGTTWSIAGPLNVGQMFRVWGSGAHDLWAVGNGVYHYDGSTWTQAVAGHSLIQFTSVWGTSPNDVWVVMGSELGGPGHLLHWDGSAWTTHVNAVAQRVLEFGGANGIVWAGDLGGGIARYVP